MNYTLCLNGFLWMKFLFTEQQIELCIAVDWQSIFLQCPSWKKTVVITFFIWQIDKKEACPQIKWEGKARSYKIDTVKNFNFKTVSEACVRLSGALYITFNKHLSSLSLTRTLWFGGSILTNMLVFWGYHSNMHAEFKNVVLLQVIKIMNAKAVKCKKIRDRGMRKIFAKIIHLGKYVQNNKGSKLFVQQNVATYFYWVN